MGALALLFILVSPATAFAQSADHDTDHEHTIVYEAGWAGEWSRDEGFGATGATLGFEVTPIEPWLSIETSVGVHHSDDGTEMPIEVAFRKPWDLSQTVEFMAGGGPEVIHVFGSNAAMYAGVSASAHFMVWPRRNLGWFAETEYEVAFPAEGTRKGLGFAVGVLIGR